MNEEDNKFDWGETIRVKKTAPEKYRPGVIASICGMEKVKFEKLAREYGIELGEWLYTIEYIGGEDQEVPERFLEKEDDNEQAV